MSPCHPLARVALIALTLVGVAPAASAGPGRTVNYNGQVLGPEGAPVSGVFEFAFKFHRNDKTTAHAWTETHFVAVDEGAYRVRLGATAPIPGNLKLDKLHISVSLGGQEFIREALGPALKAAEVSERAVPAAPPVGPRAGPASPLTGAAGANRGRGGVVEYADRAGYALESEHASTADKIDGKDLDDVADYIAKKQGKKRIRVGNSRKLGTHVGGYGGSAYEEVCPRGYVMIGVRGTAGMYLDGTQIICAPLELD